MELRAGGTQKGLITYVLCGQFATEWNSTAYFLERINKTRSNNDSVVSKSPRRFIHAGKAKRELHGLPPVRVSGETRIFTRKPRFAAGINRHFKRADAREKSRTCPRTIDNDVYAMKWLRAPRVLYLALQESQPEYKARAASVIQGYVRCSWMSLMTYSIPENSRYETARSRPGRNLIVDH